MMDQGVHEFHEQDVNSIEQEAIQYLTVDYRGYLIADSVVEGWIVRVKPTQSQIRHVGTTARKEEKKYDKIEHPVGDVLRVTIVVMAATARVKIGHEDWKVG